MIPTRRSLAAAEKQEPAIYPDLLADAALIDAMHAASTNVSDKGVVSLAEKEPTPESPASIVVQFRLPEIASFVSDDLGKFNLSEEIRFMVKSSIAGSWTFTFKNGERLVMHKQVSVA